MQNPNNNSSASHTLAVLAILGAALVLSLGDALVKFLSAEVSLWQLFVVRSAMAIPILIVLQNLSSQDVRLIPQRTGWVVLRSLMLCLMWVAYYLALPHIKLSVAAAIYYTIPLFITLFSNIGQRERISFRGWLAVSLGFVGVLVIVRPETNSASYYVVLPLLAAILYALAMILTRTHCRHEHPLALSLLLNLTFIAVGVTASGILLWVAPTPEAQAENRNLLGNWIVPGQLELLILAALACITVAGSVLAAIAYQRGPSSLIATFDYAYLPFSIGWGFLFFAEAIDSKTLIGIVFIIAAGWIASRASNSP